VELKNLSCTHRFSGYFSNRSRVNSLRYVAQWSYWFRYVLSSYIDSR